MSWSPGETERVISKNGRYCVDCGSDISNRSKMAKRCPECVEIKKRKDNLEKMRSGKGRSISDNYKFKEIAHKAQGDACIICGWTIKGAMYGGCIAHHIIHVSKGGKSTAENAAVICPNCHATAHCGMIGEDKLRESAKRAYYVKHNQDKFIFTESDKKMEFTVRERLGKILNM
jgi:5-methylcytosine-specific restriction endonuclease McrA